VLIGDKQDIVNGLRGRYGVILAHLAGEDLYGAYRAWVTADKPCSLLAWLRDTFELDAA
jgi:hypothetical protein